jgi:cephalosporin-C deacetylase
MSRPQDPILEPYPPPDFDEFWSRTVAGRGDRPIAAYRTHDPKDDIPGFRIERIDFRGDQGDILHGWIGIPHGLTGPAPGHLWLTAYGHDSHLPDLYSCYPDYINLSYNIHGHDAFYQEKYVPSRGYLAVGIEDPETYIFRRLALDALRALDVLASQTEVDSERLVCGGLSQGGGLSLMMAMIAPKLRSVCTDMPFLSSMPWAMKKASYRYPYKELKDFADTHALGMEQVMGTLAYFDTLNCASRAKCPVQVSYGTLDPACTPNTVIAIAQALPDPKNLIVYEELGHDWTPEMRAINMAWHRRFIP